MRKTGVLLGVLAAAAVLTAPAAVFAMPSDIEEAVSSGDYNAYDHVGGSAYYDESELISIDAYYVATANAMIRTAPFGEIIGSVTPGESYYVEGECEDCMWYKISSGYVYASYLVPESDYVDSTGSNTSDGSFNIHQVNIKMTITDAASVNMRSLPSTNGSVIDILYEGMEVTVTGKVMGREWYQCEYDGLTGYVCDDYLTPEFPQSMACTTSVLNVRASASTDAQVIGTLKQGDVIRASAEENDFLRFSLEDGTIGYVYDEYMAAK